MAEGFAKAYADKMARVESAALEGQSKVNPVAIQVMEDIGISLAEHTSKMISTFKPEDFDIVVSMCGCGATVPDEWKAGKRFEDWNVEDPTGQELSAYLETREEIRQRVEELVSSHYEQRPPTYSLYLEDDACSYKPKSKNSV
ncbi:hypothetical protein BZG36_01599 [Bifiguratus adelaidae]|uniref:Phosphotyrosine protein phosphatase I domain-containing protein n=1 Tax=Bifiguratus adelaidae TaxID=1938954 RepID=A0A261Y4H2_9FUNG|nr:hypothetical protein BZG36_01599 [Bifiguratus adelaidae]